MAHRYHSVMFLVQRQRYQAFNVSETKEMGRRMNMMEWSGYALENIRCGDMLDIIMDLEGKVFVKRKVFGEKKDEARPQEETNTKP